MAKRPIPLCKKCGQYHWYVVACDKAAASAERAERLAREEQERAATVEREHAEIDERQRVRRTPTVILRHPRAGMSDQLHSVVRMGERTLARPRERGQSIGSIREVR